jgi:two-component system, cell cycle response regulator DivK
MPQPHIPTYVMVVEDNADNMLVITELLLTLPSVRYSNVRSSPRQFFAFMARDDAPPINLILLDLHLPLEDGYATLPKIRAHPKLANARVVAVSASVGIDEVRRAQAAGFDGFLGKPLNRHRFADQIQRILAGEAVWEPT